MIPKIIHYCWLSNDKYPEVIKNNIASWETKLPDYEFMLWDTSRFDLSKSAWARQAYDNKKYAFASDLIRLYALYNYGGIYMDTDVEVIKSFDDILNLPYFIGSQHDSLIEAAVIGSEKESDWILSCIQHYEDRFFIKADGKFDLLILPRIMKSQLEGIRSISIMKPNEVQEARSLLKNEDSLILFPFEYFSAKNYETGETTQTENTYTIHHFASAWLPLLSKLRRKSIRSIGVGRTEKIISSIKLRKLTMIIKVITEKYRLKLKK